MCCRPGPRWSGCEGPPYPRSRASTAESPAASPSILTTLSRLVAPRTRVTSPGRTPKAAATARSAAAVACPPTGRALTRTRSASPRVPPTTVRGAASRDKVVRIDGDAAELSAVLARLRA